MALTEEVVDPLGGRTYVEGVGCLLVLLPCILYFLVFQDGM